MSTRENIALIRFCIKGEYHYKIFWEPADVDECPLTRSYSRIRKITFSWKTKSDSLPVERRIMLFALCKCKRNKSHASKTNWLLRTASISLSALLKLRQQQKSYLIKEIKKKKEMNKKKLDISQFTYKSHNSLTGCLWLTDAEIMTKGAERIRQRKKTTQINACHKRRSWRGAKELKRRRRRRKKRIKQIHLKVLFLFWLRSLHLS